MLAAAVAVTSAANWVPARWNSNDPNSLELVSETPVNCLLLERPLWSAAFAKAAAARGIAVLGVAHSTAEGAAAEAAGLSGVVYEGDFEVPANSLRLTSRAALRLNGSLLGTTQGVWPGIRTDIKAAPTGGPWIDTNSGFLRFLRAAAPAPVWIANQPPTGQVLPVSRYLQAIGDAAIVGARWVVSLDDGFSRRLLAREPKALADWKAIGAELAFFEAHPEWRTLKPFGRLAIVQDPSTGALLSGGVLDMIAVKHTPVVPVPPAELTDSALANARMAVDVDPSALTPEQRDLLKGFARRGGTVLTGPPGWKFPPPRADQITLTQQELTRVDDVWKGINSMIGRTNLGVRLFNVSGVLSSLLGDAEGKRLVLELLNYTSYPVESITVQMAGRYSSATLYEPGQPPRKLEVYETEDGTGVDIDRLSVSAAIEIE